MPRRTTEPCYHRMRFGVAGLTIFRQVAVTLRRRSCPVMLAASQGRHPDRAGHETECPARRREFVLEPTRSRPMSGTTGLRSIALAGAGPAPGAALTVSGHMTQGRRN